MDSSGYIERRILDESSNLALVSKVDKYSDLKIFFDYQNYKILSGRSATEIRGTNRVIKKTAEKYKELQEVLEATIMGPNAINISNVVPDKAGVYCFVAKKDFSLSVSELFKNFIFLNLKDGAIHSSCQCTPLLNIFQNEAKQTNEIIDFKTGQIVYIGESKKLHDRYIQHLGSLPKNPCSMKIGIRSYLLESLDYFYFDSKKRKYTNTEVEKYIRQAYGARFGK